MQNTNVEGDYGGMKEDEKGMPLICGLERLSSNTWKQQFNPQPWSTQNRCLALSWAQFSLEQLNFFDEAEMKERIPAGIGVK